MTVHTPPLLTLVGQSTLESVLAAALRTGGDFAEVFVEDRVNSSALMDDGRIEELTSGAERGAGIRVIRGDTTGFAHTADLSEKGLLAAAEAASAAARSGAGGSRSVALTDRSQPRPHLVSIDPVGVPKSEKVELLKRADAAARAAGCHSTGDRRLRGRPTTHPRGELRRHVGR